jgi:phosphohistidine phosphatase
MLFLVHHADAVGPDVDPQRPLSDSGRAHAERLAQEAAARGATPDVVWHSGKLRARQTADAFRRACNPRAEFKAIHGLQPDDPPEWIRDTVSGDDRAIMLVGHMPSLPRILHLLLSAGGGGSSVTFPPHGIVALARAGAGWDERWRLG